ncbi:MAG: aminopeptidase [Lachnospiraceae bacterium]|nr:aminopeptidase [Ruminococcus sp.]MCM1274126.1 aminopeptidase [Lachnospiraceae bacterium]
MAKKEISAKELEERLFLQKKNAYLRMSDAEIKKCDKFCEGYKAFLDAAKTEREAAGFIEREAKAKGFVPFDKDKTYKAGDRVYYVNREKSVILAVIGKEPIENGVNLVAAHIDSPRLDMKQNPLYEKDEVGYFKTHYYGGIKKYQWPTVPLSLHGVIIKSDGSKITVSIGEDENDPVFCVSDLLPHLANTQYKRPATELIRGEELNIIVGSRPFKDDEASERVKLNLLLLLNEKYGITEGDFLSAELEAVPAFKARDIGFDRSLVGGYGQDDRVCAYTELMAVLNAKSVRRTAVAILTDKEETGSDGNTGLRSAYLKYFIADLAATFGVRGREVLSNSRCLSADVNAAYDPTFPDVFEKNNACVLNGGVCVTKYTGSRGKSGTSDASAEFVGEIRRLLDSKGVIWQTGELGKVDIGGGGTVAAYIANLNVDTIDVGVPVMSMHAPFEITAKTDVYAAFKAFEAFIGQ